MFLGIGQFLSSGICKWLIRLATVAVLTLAPPVARADASIPDLAVRMGGGDVADRSAAIARTLDFGQPVMIPLMRLARAGTVAQRRGALIGLSLLPLPGLATHAFLSGLSDDDRSVRSLAAHALALAGRSAAPETARLLAHPTPRVRDGAAFALQLMGDDAVDALAATLSSADPAVRARAAWLLGRRESAALRAVPQLVQALDTPDDRAMHVAAEAIDLIGPDPAILVHHMALIGRNCGWFERMGGDAAPVLTRLLVRAGTPTGQAAFRTLAAIGRPALPALSKAVEAGDLPQRTAAALLLLHLDPSSADVLPRELRDALGDATVHP